MEKEQLFHEIRQALERRDAELLRELSNECSETAFITQDKEVIDLGVIAYSFSKILFKAHYKSKFAELLANTEKNIENRNLAGAIQEIKEFDRTHGFFQGNITKKAKIKMGARLYTRGMSLSRAAELVSVNISDILKYSGGTQLSEKTSSSVKERLKVAREIFK